MDLDRARELAAEAGYFGDDTGESIGTTTTADLLDLIDRDLRSGDVFSAAQGDRSRQAFQEDREHARLGATVRSEEHTSELQSLLRISYAVFCLKKKTTILMTKPSNSLVWCHSQVYPKACHTE